MKTAAIIRIVVGVVSAVLLTALLIAILTGRTIFHRTPRQADAVNDSYTYRVTDEGSKKPGQPQEGKKQQGENGGAAYIAGGDSVSFSGIDSIEIQWVAGQVQLLAGEGEDIVFSESSAKTLTDAQRLRYTVFNGKLTISYCESTTRLWDWLDIDRLNMPAKNLTVTVPAKMLENLKKIEVDAVSAQVISEGVFAAEYDLESVSGGIAVSGAICRSLETETVSGSVRITGMDVEELDMRSTSGKLNAAGSARDIETEATSNDTVLTLSAAPKKVDMESVSGDLTLVLPAAATDFSAHVKTVSGDFACDFPSVMQKKRYVVGNGAAEYEFESVSGDITIGKG